MLTAYEKHSSQAGYGYVSAKITDADLIPKPLRAAGGVVFTMRFQRRGQPLP